MVSTTVLDAMSRCTWRPLTSLALALLLLAICYAPAGAQEAEIDAFVRAQIAARRIPGASVAVVTDGTVVLARGLRCTFTLKQDGTIAGIGLRLE